MESSELHRFCDVSVAEEEGFDLGESKQKGEQLGGVFEAGDLGESGRLRVVVDHDEGGTRGLGFELLLQPGELRFSKKARGLVGEFERVEQVPIAEGSAQNRDPFIQDRGTPGGQGSEAEPGGGGLEEMVAVVVVTEGQVDGDAGVGSRLEKRGEGLVVFRLTVEVGAIAIDEQALKGLGGVGLQNLIDGLSEVVGHGDAAGQRVRVSGDVGIREEGPRFRSRRGGKGAGRPRGMERERAEKGREEVTAREPLGEEVQGHGGRVAGSERKSMRRSWGGFLERPEAEREEAETGGVQEHGVEDEGESQVADGFPSYDRQESRGAGRGV